MVTLFTEEALFIEDEITRLASGFEVGNFRSTETILNDTTFMVTVWTSMNRIGK